ncbi:MMPL family transporter [Agrococcus sp. SCSIO52902]|uniref:MMPL family transporter n=1 Tax=Agrococcus sp. SCSIO52902 TaxID=2933290 RepID=UPI001FF277D2|nr:MMPL family transporter [Agrococcus sp. SCSIO52902]UOW01096.1 MMPL family transporter [Agrococcus sp. SCSIO52902]
MATWLARVGAASMRRAWLVIVAWVAILGGVLGGALALGPNMQESFAIPGTESQQALDRLGSVFPQVAGSSVQVVYQAPDGAEVLDFQAEIQQQASEIEAIDDVASVVEPWSEFASDQVSADGETAFTQVQFEPQGSGVTPAGLDELVATADAARAGGLTVEFGGQAFQATSVPISWVEGVGVLFAAIVLFVTFWSLLAAGLPLITALVGVAITMGGVLGASALVTVSNSAPLMALMIGLAVGIDYALFILSKHRSQLARGMGVVESGSLAVGTAGTAVVFAGLTVVIALVGLLIVGIPFLSVMGIGAAASVAIAVAAATTLLPAIMALLGERLRPRPGSRAARLAERDVDAQPTLGMRWVTGITKRPWLAIVGVLVVVGVASVPAASLELALPDNGREERGTTQRIAYDLLQEGFGEGTTGPLVVMADITQVTDIMPTLEAISDDLAAIDGVDRIGSAFPDETADTAIIQVIAETGPADHATAELVRAIRDAAPALEAEHGTPIAVTGATAVQIDVSQRLQDALLPFGIVVVTLAVVLLLLVFRSILVPVTAAIGFVLSVLAAFGTVVATLQWGWGAELLHTEAGPILSFMPVLLMAVLFGLAMDYQVFLVSGMREAHAHGHSAISAVRHGFAANARVVTAAALIMFFVFFAFVPEGMAMIKAIALGLAVGVAVDAFLVRMTLIPAVMTLLGERAWWLPRWLDRAMPDMDVEGESLGRHRAALACAADAGGHLALERLRPEVDHDRPGSASWTVTAPRGAVVRLDAPFTERQRLAHALLGDVGAAGHAHLGGAALPGDVPLLRSRLALVDLDLVDAGFIEPGGRAETAHHAARAALSLRTPLALGATLDRRASALVERAAAALGSPIDASAPLSRLSPLARAAVLVAIALERQPSLVWIDAATGAPAGAARVAARLGGDDLTIVTSEPAPEAHGRPAIDLAPDDAAADDRAAADASTAASDPTDTGDATAALATTGADR